MILALIGGGIALYFLGPWRVWTAEFTGPVWTVKKEKLQLTIVERGFLESAENSEIICRVKSGTRGSSQSTIIKWLIDDGMNVNKGDKILELDDSALVEQKKAQAITVNQAYAAMIQAEQNFLITQSQNNSEIETAKTALILAQLDLKKYIGERAAAKILKLEEQIALQKYLRGGLEEDLKAELAADKKGKSVCEYVQMRNDIEGRIETARSDREMWLDRASWSQRMVKKGFLSRSQAEADRSRLDSADFNLRKVQNELDILRVFLLERNLTDLWSKVKEAERALERTKTQAKSKEVQAEAEKESKKAVYDQEHERLNETEREIDKCKIYSPQNGMVVYYVPEQSRFGSGSQQSIIAQGEPVREGQKMMRIPNLSLMLVNARVHEAMVSKVRGEVYRPTGFGDAWRGANLALQPNLAGILALHAYHELRDESVELESGETRKIKELELEPVFGGQKAFIRIDAFPTKVYPGHVKTVATVASQADFLSSDVKVYQTMVAMDGTVEDLKPGMSAEVTILAEESPEPVLVIPIHSVVGSIAMGAKRKVFLLDERNRPVLKDIVVGGSNDKMVEVREGLSEGDRIVLNPGPLLKEEDGLKPAVPGKMRGVDIDSFGGGKGKKGGGGSGGGGSGGPGGAGKWKRPPQGAGGPPGGGPGNGGGAPAFRKE